MKKSLKKMFVVLSLIMGITSVSICYAGEVDDPIGGRRCIVAPQPPTIVITIINEEEIIKTVY